MIEKLYLLDILFKAIGPALFIDKDIHVYSKCNHNKQEIQQGEDTWKRQK